MDAKSIGSEVMTKGIPVPESIIIRPATFDKVSGAVDVEVAFEFSKGRKITLGFEGPTASPAFSEALVFVNNEFRREIAADDDSPHRFTLQEVGAVALGLFMGK